MAAPFLFAHTRNQSSESQDPSNPASPAFKDNFDSTLNTYLASIMNTPMQSQYRNYPGQSNQRSPHASAARRGPGPMISSSNPQPIHTAAQMQAQQASDAQKLELAKRRSRKPTDKNIPEGVEAVILGDGVQTYKDLREVERRLDAAMMRKRLDIQDSVNRNVKRYKTLRIWISNTAENQPWQARGLDENAFDFSTGMEGSYKVKIEGRLLDDVDDDKSDSDSEDDEGGQDGEQEKDKNTMETDGGDVTDTTSKIPGPKRRKKLSHFFKSMRVDFDHSKSLQPDPATQIEWKKPPVQPNNPNPPPEADFDSLEFERKSDENLNCTINLVRDENPERYRLSKELAAVLDTDEEARAGVVMGIWDYVKALGLQEDEDKRSARCDERLRAIFKQDHVFFPHIPDLVLPHLSALPPLKLPYTIRVDPSHHLSPTPTIYDILVPLDDPLRSQMLAVTNNPTYPTTLRSLSTLDDQLAVLIQAIAHSKAKHNFFTHMGRDPATFMGRWKSSQKRDQEVFMGEATRGGGEDGQGEEFRRGGKRGVWGTEPVRESVALWLSRSR
ncbi:MAG: SWI/SNF complex component snf12 [Candelina mexicana]|nr:MAG: SWI/SNF complex component snf12 [Candelina mexicana]